MRRKQAESNEWSKKEIISQHRRVINRRKKIKLKADWKTKRFIFCERELSSGEEIGFKVTSSRQSVMSPASAGTTMHVSHSISSSSSTITSTCKFLLIVSIFFISVTNVCCELNKNCEYITNFSQSRTWRKLKTYLWPATVFFSLPFFLQLLHSTINSTINLNIIK